MEEKKIKDTRARSRLYPRYDLDDAIKFIKVLSKMGGTRVSMDAVAAEMGKSTTNSTFSGRVSSAKQFALVALEGGKLSLTALGKTVMFPPSDTDKENAIKKSFTQPPLYQELVASFKGKVIPEKSALGNRLVHDYQIEAAAKDVAARNFINSAQFANAVHNGILLVDDTADVVEVKDDTEENQVPDEKQAPKQKANYDEAENFVFDFAGGIKLVIPKNQKTSEAIADGELKDARKALAAFATQYVATAPEVNVTGEQE
jgi:hypothetical protein